MEAISVSQGCLIPWPFSWKLFSLDYFFSPAVASCHPHGSVLMLKPSLISEDHAPGKEHYHEFSQPPTGFPSPFFHRPDTVMILSFKCGTTKCCLVDSVGEDTIWNSAKARLVLFGLSFLSPSLDISQALLPYMFSM